MKELWDKRYQSTEYIYGVEPNQFFKNELANLSPGSILFPAEGEGRNAVHAALNGWKVSAFDISAEGKKKAEKLASQNQTQIDYQVGDFKLYDELNDQQFDCIVLTFAHTPPLVREENHSLVQKWLKPGGTIILQAFSKKQVRNNSGGPIKMPEMLFSREELESDFQNLTNFNITESEIDLNEGPLHKGKADVINLVGIK